MIVWKLDELMRTRGIKGRELARRMNIGENYLSRVRHEVPDRLSLSLLDALCRELGCGIADLLEYKVAGRARRSAAAPPSGSPPSASPPTAAPASKRAAPPPPVDVGQPAEAAPVSAAEGAPDLTDDETSDFFADVLAPLFAELGPAAELVEQAMATQPRPIAAPAEAVAEPLAEPFAPETPAAAEPTLPAPAEPTMPETAAPPSPEPTAAEAAPGSSAVMRTSALQARLERLKRQRQQP